MAAAILATQLVTRSSVAGVGNRRMLESFEELSVGVVGSEFEAAGGSLEVSIVVSFTESCHRNRQGTVEVVGGGGVG